jgi:hypothetical protein
MNNIYIDTQSLNSKVAGLSQNISTTQESNTTLQSKINSYNVGSKTSKIMEDDYRTLYFEQYISNVATILGILLASYVTVHTFDVKSFLT